MAASLRSQGRDQLLLFAVMLATAVGNTGLQSVLPGIGRDLRLPDWVIGIAFSFSALIWSLAAPFWARRLNRVGYKKMLLLGLGGFVAASFICGISLALAVVGWVAAGLAFAIFMAGRCVYGLVGAAAPPAAQALIAARSSREERTRALTLLASAFGVGTIVGPALAPFFVLPFVGLAGPLFVFAFFGLAMWVVVATYLSDTPVEQRPHGAANEETVAGVDPSEASVVAANADEDGERVRLTDPRVLPWLLIGIVAGHTQAMAGQTIAFLVIDRTGLPPAQAQSYVGIVLMAGAMTALLAQWGIIPRVNARPRQLVLWGCMLAAAGSVLIALLGDLHGTAIAFALTSLGYGLLRPGVTAGASLAVTDREQGVVAGHVTAINGASFILGPSIGILLYESWQPMPYLACTIILVLLTAYGLRRLRGVAAPE